MILIEDRFGVAMGNREIIVLEALGGHAARIEVELVDEQYVGPDPLDDLRDRVRLRATRRRQFNGQVTGAEPVQRGVEGGEANRILCRLCRQ